jgi:hypothetical protein
MVQAQECRAKARECEEMAARVPEWELQELWKAMASKWRQLAQKVEAALSK